jgi:hypothetical protein
MKTMLTFAILCALVCAVVWAQAPAPPASQQPPAPRAPGAVGAGFEGSAYGKARDIPARIVNFTAEPASIKPGQSVTLVWLTDTTGMRDIPS